MDYKIKNGEYFLDEEFKKKAIEILKTPIPEGIKDELKKILNPEKNLKNKKFKLNHTRILLKPVLKNIL